MDPLATQHVLISGTRIAYGVRGEGNPIVLVHGTPSSSLIWRNVVPRLTSAGYRVHVFDLLGYSLSERPWDPSIDTSISGQVPILEALFRHWGLEKAHVVAHDIGGGIAQRLAVFSPHLFRSLTLIDVVSFDSYPSKRTREQMQKGLETLIKAPDKEHRDHFRDWLLSAVHNKDRFIDASLETFLGHTMEIADRLSEVGRNMSVQLIWGAQDQWQAIDWARKLQEAIPGSQLHILDNCGHFCLEDEPVKIAELVRGFIGGK